METLDLLRQWLQTCPALAGEKLLLDFLSRASGWSVSALRETPTKDILGNRGGRTVIRLCRRCLPADDHERSEARAHLAAVTVWTEENAPGTAIAGILRLRAAVPAGPVRLAARGSAGTEDYEQILILFYERTGGH